MTEGGAKSGTNAREDVEMNDSEGSVVEPQPADGFTDTGDKGLNRYLTIALIAFNVAAVALLFGEATISTLFKVPSIDGVTSNNDKLNTHSSTTRMGQQTRPSSILESNLTSATRILSVPKMGCRPDRFDNEGNQEGNNKLFAGSYVCSDDADQRYWFGIDPETGNLIWRDTFTGQVKTYYTNEWHKQYLEQQKQKKQNQGRRRQQQKSEKLEGRKRRRRMTQNLQKWSQDKIQHWKDHLTSEAPPPFEARAGAANQLRNLQYKGECWKWVQVSRSVNGRVQFEARPTECKDDNPPADQAEDVAVGDTVDTENSDGVKLDKEGEDNYDCLEWVAVKDEKTGRMIFTATPSGDCTDPIIDIDGNASTNLMAELEEEDTVDGELVILEEEGAEEEEKMPSTPAPIPAPTKAPNPAPTGQPTPAPTPELIVDYYFTLSIEATFRIHRVYRTEDYKIVNEVLHYELPSTYDIREVYKNCLFTHDCPYMHLHQDGVMVLAWLDYENSKYSNGWMEKNIKRCYDFDTNDTL